MFLIPPPPPPVNIETCYGTYNSDSSILDWWPILLFNKWYYSLSIHQCMYMRYATLYPARKFQIFYAMHLSLVAFITTDIILQYMS